MLAVSVRPFFNSYITHCIKGGLSVIHTLLEIRLKSGDLLLFLSADPCPDPF